MVYEQALFDVMLGPALVLFIWGKIEELEGRILRVITLEDKITIHNAFPDRGFKP